MQDDRRYYIDLAAREFTLAAQAADPIVRNIHTEIAEAYAQLAAVPPVSARPVRRLDA